MGGGGGWGVFDHFAHGQGMIEAFEIREACAFTGIPAVLEGSGGLFPT